MAEFAIQAQAQDINFIAKFELNTNPFLPLHSRHTATNIAAITDNVLFPDSLLST